MIIKNDSHDFLVFVYAETTRLSANKIRFA